MYILTIWNCCNVPLDHCLFQVKNDKRMFFEKVYRLQVGELKTRNHIRTPIQFEINSNLTFAEIERETDDLPSSLENISFYKLECFFEREFEINFNLTSTYLRWNAFEGSFKMQNIPNSVLSLATKTWYWTSEQASHAF